MSKDNFMKCWFSNLNHDCQINIIKFVNFSTEIKFNLDDKIKIDNINIIIKHQPIWDSKFKDWVYQCINEIKCCNCNDVQEKLYFYKQEELISKNIKLQYKKCKDCKKPLCYNCYYKETGSWKTMCNQCIWWELG